MINQDTTSHMMSLTEVAEYFGMNNEYVSKEIFTIPGFPVMKIKKRYFVDSGLLKEWIVQNKNSTFS